MRALALDSSHGPQPGWSADHVGPVYRRIVWPGPGAALQPLPAPRAGLHGLGQFDAFGSMVAGSAPTAAGTPWWQQLLTAGTSIATARFGQPPAGTYIRTAEGTYSRTDPRLAINPPFGIEGSGISMWALIGGAVLLVVLVAGKGRG